MLFGHSVRVWDCCISDSVCTSNVFDLLYIFLNILLCVICVHLSIMLKSF